MSAAPAYAAPVLMTAHVGGATLSSPLTVTKSLPTARALIVPAAVLALPGLTLTARLVLAEVLDLHQVNGRVWAKDEHFATRLGCSPRSVRDAVADLESGGYLTREVNHHGQQKRILTPTDLWQNLPEVVAEFATSPAEVPANSATTSGKTCHDSRQNLPRVPANSANINTSLNYRGNSP